MPSVDPRVESACIASMKGDVLALQTFDPSVWTQNARSGFTPMHYACAYRQESSIKYLVHEMGGAIAHVRACNDAKTTPFLMCVFNDMLHLLPSAVFATQYKELYSEEELASVRARVSPAMEKHMAVWSMDRAKRWSMFMDAIEADDANIVNEVPWVALERNDKGVCALWCACAIGATAVAQAMLCHVRGADMDHALFTKEPHLGTSAFFMMLLNGLDEVCVAAMLIAHPARLAAVRDDRTKSGHTCRDVVVHCSPVVQRVFDAR